MSDIPIHAHLVGIKGVAMAALAVYLSEKGIRVTGSDVSDTFPTEEELSRAGIAVLIGFSPSHITDDIPDVVYYTGAHQGRENPEVMEAVSRNIPVFAHGKGLGDIMASFRQFIVAGSHGKTTTSAMIASTLHAMGIDASYAIGCGSISSRYPAGHFGTSDIFVAEGDEYITDPNHDPTPRFLWTKPEMLVITNIDYDHPDAYPDLTAVTHAFEKLAKKAGTIVYSRDDENSAWLRNHKHAISYGLSPESDIRITNIRPGNECMQFTLSKKGTLMGECTISVPGVHNVKDAAAAIACLTAAGWGEKACIDGIRSFTGTKRRFEKVGSVSSALIYDDYAHHPKEIQATLAAARLWYPDRRIIAVFQPHTYSRTKALLSDFAKSFSDASTVVLTDVYASAREHDTLGIDGMTLVTETRKYHPNVEYKKGYTDVSSYLFDTLRQGDIVIFMGAGDIYTWVHSFVAGKHTL